MNILHTIRRRQGNWIGHILRKNCAVKPVMEGKLKGRTDMTVRRGRRIKQLLNDLKEKRGCLKLKRGSTIRHCVKNRFGGGYGLFARQATQWLKIHINIILPSKPLTSKLSLSFTLLSHVFLPKPCCTAFSPPIRVTCPAHLILFDSITRIMLGEE